ncbi:hypothetical protein BGZ94_006606 [Podila epigama]|nr:hypothetical protein BGZ94_006606 [Podila epigama]
MSLFKSSKNTNASAALVASSSNIILVQTPLVQTPLVQPPRSSVQASSPKQQQTKTITPEQALSKALNSSAAGGPIVARPHHNSFAKQK